MAFVTLTAARGRPEGTRAKGFLTLPLWAFGLGALAAFLAGLADRARSLVLDAVCQLGLFADREGLALPLRAHVPGFVAGMVLVPRIAISAGPLAPL